MYEKHKLLCYNYDNYYNENYYIDNNNYYYNYNPFTPKI